ncbi:MlaD family protein [Patulibacter medicamentivorans]|uniref:MlaD family protein n=1 Tax=Patulibacter medicamentivorans TaxID=1097667 RepID=UPI0002F0A4C5|nr:MlaD family protein [Patulibacter medicamentivorans]
MTRRTLGLLVVVAAIVVTGVAAAAYVLVHQRLPVPFRDVYELRASLVAADGVAPGLGQPVQVAGVKVGTITAARVERGRALVTLEIDRRELPTVHADASVALRPVTPLDDMRIELDPGHRASGPLPPGGRIDQARTTTPAALDELLGALDADTRDFLASLISSLDAGTAGRGDDLRRALRTLGPTVGQVRRIAASLAGRRRELSRLVGNVAVITRAASRDDRLAALVADGNRTLRAVADQDAALRQALTRLPRTLTTTSRALRSAGGLAAELPPTLTALQPAVRRLPATLAALEPFSGRLRDALRDDVRPLARELTPLLGELRPAVSGLRTAEPDLRGVLQSTNYLLNSLAYNPPGDDEGFLFWASWFVHNWNSLFSTADAHGGIGRAMVMVNCGQLTQLADLGPLLKLLLGSPTLCPG